NSHVRFGSAGRGTRPAERLTLRSDPPLTIGWLICSTMSSTPGPIWPIRSGWSGAIVVARTTCATPRLANRLRRDDLPAAWMAPPDVRELRELVRYRAKLVALRTSAKAQVHAVMAKLGILPPQAEMFGPTGQVLLDELPFDGVYAIRVESLGDLLEI